MTKHKKQKKGNNAVLAIGVIIMLVGFWLVFSSGADFSRLPLLDISAKFGDAEVTATNVPPEAEKKIISGFVVSIIGFITMGISRVL